MVWRDSNKKKKICTNLVCKAVCCNWNVCATFFVSFLSFFLLVGFLKWFKRFLANTRPAKFWEMVPMPPWKVKHLHTLAPARAYASTLTKPLPPIQCNHSEAMHVSKLPSHRKIRYLVLNTDLLLTVECIRSKLANTMRWKSLTRDWWKVVSIWFVTRSMCLGKSLKIIRTFWAWLTTLKPLIIVSFMFRFVLIHACYPYSPCMILGIPKLHSVLGDWSCSWRRVVWPYLSKG